MDDGRETSVQGQCAFVCSPPRTDLCFPHSATSATSGASSTKSLSTQTNSSSTRRRTLREFVLNAPGSKLTLPRSAHPHAFISQDDSDYESPSPRDSPLRTRSTVRRPGRRALSESDKASTPVSSPVRGAGRLAHSLSPFKPGAVAPSPVVLAAQQVMAVSNKLGPQFEHFIENLDAVHSAINSVTVARNKLKKCVRSSTRDDAAEALRNAKADRKSALAELATVVANIPDVVSEFDRAKNTYLDSKGTVDSLFDDFFSSSEDEPDGMFPSSCLVFGADCCSAASSYQPPQKRKRGNKKSSPQVKLGVFSSKVMKLQ